jgi:hypothetical protein
MITPQVVTSQEETLTEEQIKLLNYIQEMTAELGDLAEAGGMKSLSVSLRGIGQIYKVRL